MATERHEHQAWYNAQVAALIELGTNPIDAVKRVGEVLDILPPGENPATYIFPAYALYQDPSAPELEQDAAAAWLESDDVPNRFKRILGARAEE